MAGLIEARHVRLAIHFMELVLFGEGNRRTFQLRTGVDLTSGDSDADKFFPGVSSACAAAAAEAAAALSAMDSAEAARSSTLLVLSYVPSGGSADGIARLRFCSVQFRWKQRARLAALAAAAHFEPQQ